MSSDPSYILGLVSTTYQDVGPHKKLATRNACIRFLSMLSERLTYKPSLKFDSMTVRKRTKSYLILGRDKAIEEIRKITRVREEIQFIIKYHKCYISAPAFPRTAIFKTHPKEWSCEKNIRY